MAIASTRIKMNQLIRLLVVDDEPLLRKKLGELLELRGYHVTQAASGTEALHYLQTTSYDLMVLDVRMPGMSGIEVLHRVQDFQDDVAVVLLTGHATVESAIAAVRLGAADYLLKPFDIDDLEHTIRHALEEKAEEKRRQQLLSTINEAVSLLQTPASPTDEPQSELDASVESTGSPPDLLQVDGLELDKEKRSITLTGEHPRTETLTEGEAAILATFMRHAGDVLSCKDLAREALEYTHLEKWEAQSVVRPYVFRLRQKIEQDSDEPQLIRTVRGRGYFLAAS
jgi:DNA-binding response OmpR family regulator